MKKFLSVMMILLLTSGCSALEPQVQTPTEKSQVEEKTPEQIAAEKKAVEDEKNRKHEERKRKDEERARRQAEIEASKVKNLGMTPDQFKWSYDELAIQNELSELSLGDIEIKIGDAQNIGQYNIASNLIFQCAIDKSSGLVKEVWLLSQPTMVEEVFLRCCLQLNNEYT